MSLNSRTPESLVARSDSKNPATTCRGITSNGKPCRRALSSPKSSPNGKGRSTLPSHSGIFDATTLYCFQHKDQAHNATIDAAVSGGQGDLGPIQERSSLDSLVARLGVVSISDLPQQAQNPHGSQTRPARDNRQSRPSTRPAEDSPPRRPSQKPEKQTRRRPGFWASLCCAGHADDDDYFEVVKHKQRVHPSRQSTSDAQSEQRPKPTVMQSQYSRPQASAYSQGSSLRKKPVSANTVRPSPAGSNLSVPSRKPLGNISSQSTNMRTSSTPDTRHLLSFIPRHLSPQTTSALLTELSKPISTKDTEGYIYIFWSTDSDKAPSEDTAASLLSPATPRRKRRPSDVMSQFSYAAASSSGGGGGGGDDKAKRTIQLKIGRANNVHRRMGEWKRQCGYNVSLVRYYPYVSAAHCSPSPSPSPAAAPEKLCPDLSRRPPGRGVSEQVRTVQHVARVERLIHLELADVRVKKDCAACGKEHREWFEIEATENGVKGVDEVIRRWVRWSETNENNTTNM